MTVGSLCSVCWCSSCACFVVHHVQVVPDKIGDKGSSYNDFICALPDNQCRYGGMKAAMHAGCQQHAHQPGLG
jgi:hypothetical protein